tara:strand:- start:104 stop:1546 length:1443 start_codon:yes stop_codon:yes gene_type:complete
MNTRLFTSEFSYIFNEDIYSIIFSFIYINNDEGLLYWADINNSSSIIKNLLDIDTNINICNYNGETPLFIASFNCLSNVKCLVYEGADIYKYNNDGDYPLHNSIYNNNYDITKFLINQNIDINVSNIDGDTPLHFSVNNNLSKITKFLVKNNADINFKNIEGYTPSYFAIINNNKDMLKFLIKNKANINSYDNSSNSLLHYSVDNNFKQITKFLIKNNADVNHINLMGETPIYNAIANNNLIITKMLFNNNSKININSCSLLHLAIYNSNFKITKFLINNNISINTYNQDGYTPLHIAINVIKPFTDNKIQNVCRLDYKDPSTLIFNYLIHNNANVNQFNIYEETPLHLAIDNNNLDIIKTLIANNSDINKYDNNDLSVFDYAIQKNNYYIITEFIRNINFIDYKFLNQKKILHLFYNYLNMKPTFINKKYNSFDKFYFIYNKSANINEFIILIIKYKYYKELSSNFIKDILYDIFEHNH